MTQSDRHPEGRRSYLTAAAALTHNQRGALIAQWAPPGVTVKTAAGTARW